MKIDGNIDGFEGSPLKVCENCKHWNIPPEWSRSGLGDCELARGTDGKPDHKESLAFAADTEQYHAVLRTKAKFGCIQWESKE